MQCFLFISLNININASPNEFVISMQKLTRIFGLMRMFSSIVNALCDFFWHHLGYQAVCL